jgi:mono/diheme cytochrome c family protein
MELPATSCLSVPMKSILFAALLFLAVGPVAQAQDNPAFMPKKQTSVFEKYCFDCHDSETQEGSVDLESIPLQISKDIETAERWAKVLNAINSGEMPPEDSEQIPDQEKLEFLEELSRQMVLARKILSDSGGEITLRRLNRREYQNTLESLIGVRPNVSGLPDDQASSGFDTEGASLFFSSNQLELYLNAARHSLDFALNSSSRVKSKTERIEPEETYTPHYEGYLEELRTRIANSKKFLASPDDPPTDLGILDAYQAKKQMRNAKKWVPQLEEYVARPETKTGATMILTIKKGGPTKIKLPPVGAHAYGRYKIRVRAAAYKDAPVRFQYLEFTSGIGKSRNHMGWRKVVGTLGDPEIIEFEFEHLPGEKQLYMIHQRTHQDRGDKNLWTLNQLENGIGTPPGVWVDWAELVGPEQFEFPQRDEILFERPQGWSEKKYVKEVIRRFATKAFRGTEPSEEYVGKLFERFESASKDGNSFKKAIVEPLAIVLSSPNFLYKVESTGGNESLSAHELATRLSYFLWSTTPDQELVELAESGKLNDPTVLREQTDRMIADPKFERFINGFVHQWLEMERIDMFQFSGAQYPEFDNAVRANSREELFSMFRLLVQERLPLKDLLHGNYVVINDLLADYYGIEGVKGHEFRKVDIPKDSVRGGLLGTCAVNVMGSDGIRSSPVERGAWVLRHLLNNPPPPAPPNVPQLSRLDGEVLSVRNLQRAHQEQPQCAQCHQKIDPIGYGLENFDPTGAWREVETVSFGKSKLGRKQTKEFEIDPRGKLHSEQTFSNFAELRDVIGEHEDDFAGGFAESLIAYGLGRPYGFTDKSLSEGMVQHAAKRQYDINEFIHALIQSKAFSTK